jgi:hypothetical protein
VFCGRIKFAFIFLIVLRAICDEINIAWAGNSDVYTNLTAEMIDQVVRSIEEDLKSCTSRLQIYEKYASQNSEYIHEIISLQEYIEELNTTKSYCEMIGTIVTQCSLSLSGFSKICCNVS